MSQLIHLKSAITVPFLEHILSHMEMHFTDLQQKAVMALRIVPSFIRENTSSGETGMLPILKTI